MRKIFLLMTTSILLDPLTANTIFQDKLTIKVLIKLVFISTLPASTYVKVEVGVEGESGLKFNYYCLTEPLIIRIQTSNYMVSCHSP
jgi:hypothetical protein